MTLAELREASERLKSLHAQLVSNLAEVTARLQRVSDAIVVDARTRANMRYVLYGMYRDRGDNSFIAYERAFSDVEKIYGPDRGRR